MKDGKVVRNSFGFFYALEIKGAVFSINAFSSTLVPSMFYLAHNVHM